MFSQNKIVFGYLSVGVQDLEKDALMKVVVSRRKIEDEAWRRGYYPPFLRIGKAYKYKLSPMPLLTR